MKIFADQKKISWAQSLWLVAILVGGIMLGTGSSAIAASSLSDSPWHSMTANPVLTASAASSATGESLFALHCAGCHPNGSNILRRGKNLKTRALRRNGYDTEAAVAQIIAQGKGNMSAFGDKLSEADIHTLATYVLQRAADNWR